MASIVVSFFFLNNFPFFTLLKYTTHTHTACQDKFKGFQSDQIIDALEEYAGVLFKRLGSKITYWLTINEPRANCDFCMHKGT